MKLIPEWRSALRMNSVQALAIIFALPLIWPMLPPEVVDLIPDTWNRYIVAGLALIGVIARLRDQGGIGQ